MIARSEIALLTLLLTACAKKPAASAALALTGDGWGEVAPCG
ncbi:MAG: hypothetical protein ACYCWW_15135 [Deltaproteobacteria bacterium]